ncbi:MAG: Rossmann-like fold-containing protein [Thalassotalea sp.]
MYINPAWRILTIGDGDLSFSASLFKHHQPEKVVATVFDNEQTLVAKYGSTYLDVLNKTKCQVITGFDVTKPETWRELSHHSFDVVIFQFPLIPAFSSFEQYQQQCDKRSVNVLNRQLLRQYLIHCFEYFLDNKGENLAFITSKDVKPYSHWNIEKGIIRKTDVNYLGKIPFEIAMFPDYQVRNVDRDKHVKPTTSYTYIYSKNVNQKLPINDLVIKKQQYGDNYCELCKVGPFNHAFDQQNHEQTKKHQKMQRFEHEWSQWLAEIS